ncbi:MAG: ribose ABC transporter permease [bacterium]|nr:ribose ABC transporter permease [bacterium]
MSHLHRALDLLGIAIIFALLCIFFSILSDLFPTLNNISYLLIHASVNIIIATGMTFVISAAEIDLSVGSLMAVCGMVTALLLKIDPATGTNIPASAASAMLSYFPDLFPGAISWWILSTIIFLAIALAPGVIAGGLTGLIVVYFGVPSFIVTLGFMLILRGLARYMTNAAPITGLPIVFFSVGTGSLFEIGDFRFAYSVAIALSVAAVGAITLAWTRFGRRVLAVGGNLEASFLSGVPVGKTRLMVFVVSGFCTAIAAIIQTSRLSIGDPNAGEGYELDAIAAVIIGGTSLFGGKGTVIGSLFGALIIAVLRNGLDLMSVTDHVKQMVIGGMIIFAVLLDYYRRRLYARA